jgi:mRNA interferase MazF
VRARRGVLYLADLKPRVGTEPGKVRPVLVVQTDLLNEAGHPSTWVLPCTIRLTGENLIRVVLPRGIAGNREECEVMIDQSRAIENRRLVRALKPLPAIILAEVVEKLKTLGELLETCPPAPPSRFPPFPVRASA